tara:strand:+ start:307 stop:741 length:435 start_codon:yes stop_codon:yes gene_type:complete
MPAFNREKRRIKFDWRTASWLFILNGAVVWLINFEKGFGEAAVQAAVVQISITIVTVGVFMPHIRYFANSKNTTRAFLYGGFLLPAIALLFSRTIHWYLGTPDLFWTTVYLACSTVVASFFYVSLKQIAPYIPFASARKLIARL